MKMLRANRGWVWVLIAWDGCKGVVGLVLYLESEVCEVVSDQACNLKLSFSSLFCKPSRKLISGTSAMTWV